MIQTNPRGTWIDESLIDHNLLLNTHNLTTDIDHTQITNKGSNTHVQIDAHIALVNEHIDWTNATQDFETSGTVTAEKFVGWGIPPVGSAIAWLKNFTGTPSLPDGWDAGNGQMHSDPDSVYNGQTLPNLNGSGGTKRFLRGSTTSGGTGGSANHKHLVNIGAHETTTSTCNQQILDSGSGTNVALSVHTHYVCWTGYSFVVQHCQIIMKSFG